MICTAFAALPFFYLWFGFWVWFWFFFLGLLENPEQLLPDLQPRFPVSPLIKWMEDLWSQLLTLYHFSSLLFSDITHFSSTFCDHSLKFSRIPPCFLLSVALQSSRNSFLNCKPVTCLPLLTRKWRSRSQAAFASMRKGWVTKGRVSRTGVAHSSSYGH